MTYPPDWPRCLFCEQPVLDGHLTCGALSCPEAQARAIRDSAHRRKSANPDRRCDSNLVDAGGNCIACGAIQGEACQQPERIPDR